MGCSLFFCPHVNDKLVFITPNPPCRQPCNTSLLYTCIEPPPPTDYSITLHLISLPAFLPHILHHSSGVPCNPFPLEEGRSRAASVACSATVSELRGGLSHFQLLGFTEAMFCIQLSPSVSVCFHCFTPAAARHQGRHFQLTLDINNGLLCASLAPNSKQGKTPVIR